MLGEEGGKQRELCFTAVPLFLPLLTAGAARLPHNPLERTPNSFIFLSSSIFLLGGRRQRGQDQEHQKAAWGKEAASVHTSLTKVPTAHSGDAPRGPYLLLGDAETVRRDL